MKEKRMRDRFPVYDFARQEKLMSVRELHELNNVFVCRCCGKTEAFYTRRRKCCGAYMIKKFLKDEIQKNPLRGAL